MERPSLHPVSVLLTSEDKALLRRVRDQRRSADPRASDAGALRDAIDRGLRLLAAEAGIAPRKSPS